MTRPSGNIPRGRSRRRADVPRGPTAATPRRPERRSSAGLWFFLALLLGNVEGKSVETFVPLDGGIVAEQNESKLFRIKEGHVAGARAARICL